MEKTSNRPSRSEAKQQAHAKHALSNNICEANTLLPSRGLATFQKLNRLFYMIAGFAFASAAAVFWMTLGFFSTHRQIPFLFQLLTIVLLAQAFGSIGLARHWFDHFFIRAGKIINILQWIAGFLAAASIFDLFMKFIHGRSQISDAFFAFVIDIILILLFVFWMAVSYCIHKDVKERKVCEFC